MRKIKFVGSTDSFYARGKDKKKRKSRGLLATAGLGTVGAGIGSELAQTGLIANKFKKTGLKNGYKFNLTDKIVSHSMGKLVIDSIRNPKSASSTPKLDSKLVKVFNKAKMRGGSGGDGGLLELGRLRRNIVSK